MVEEETPQKTETKKGGKICAIEAAQEELGEKMEGKAGTGKQLRQRNGSREKRHPTDKRSGNGAKQRKCRG